MLGKINVFGGGKLSCFGGQQRAEVLPTLHLPRLSWLFTRVWGIPLDLYGVHSEHGCHLLF